MTLSPLRIGPASGLSALLCFAPAASGLPQSPTAGEVARFLDQATFGTTLDELVGFQAAGSFDGWIDAQVALPPSLHLPRTKTLAVWMCTDQGITPAGETDGAHREARRTAWWEHAIEAPDQLRQRVAFALSEIFVVSDQASPYHKQYGYADYYDVLVRNAFGNYRDLIEEVTLHPIMGNYLSMLRNAKADPAKNVFPDENFARELMQLFSIGVAELNPDGSPQLLGGELQPTYGQDEIREFARALTGWSYANIGWDTWEGLGDATIPMGAFPDRHDAGSKTLLGGVVLPAGQSPEQDLNAVLDNVFAHPNVGPFLGRQLIQRLTTSNPSPGYVSRVAQAFEDDGQGVRGNLGAVVRAILLDPEARGGVDLEPTFGKLREPLIRLAHVRRAFRAIPVEFQGSYHSGVPCGQPSYEAWPVPDPLEIEFGQNVLAARSVFNFFLPSFSAPGPLGDAGLVGPEFGIANESTLPGSANLIDFEIEHVPVPWSTWVSLDTGFEETVLQGLGTDALLDHLALILLGGQMPSAMRVALRDHLDTPGIFGTQDPTRSRVRDAILLIVESPDYLIQS